VGAVAVGRADQISRAHLPGRLRRERDLLPNDIVRPDRGALIQRRGGADTPTGAFALLTTNGMLPVFWMSNVNVREVPTGTDPKSVVGGLNSRCAVPVTALPARFTTTLPFVEVIENEALSLPAAVGEYSTATPSDCCGAITVPTAGRPVTLNGADAADVAVTVSSVRPVFVMLTARVLVVDVAIVPKSSGLGVAANPGLVPVPCRSSVTGPRLVSSDSVAEAAPVKLGVNVTGRSSVSAAFSVLGNTAPSTENGALVDALFTVIVRDAVKCRFRSPSCRHRPDRRRRLTGQGDRSRAAKGIQHAVAVADINPAAARRRHLKLRGGADRGGPAQLQYAVGRPSCHRRVAARCRRPHRR